MDCKDYVATPYSNPAWFIASTASSTTSRGAVLMASKRHQRIRNENDLANKKYCKMQALAASNMVREGQSTWPV
jgi:hypothetical protein